MVQTSAAVWFTAWAGTARELEEAVDALRERVLPGGQLAVFLRPASGPERDITHDAITNRLAEGKLYQIVVEVSDRDGERLVIVLGPDLPTPVALRDDQADEGAAGNIITATAATSHEASRLVDEALELFRSGIPRWSKLRRKGHLDPLRLENLAGLAMVAVGIVAGLIVVWPWGWFLGLFVSLVLLLIGLEVVENLFPPFEIHGGRLRWRRRWWPAALLIAIPLATSALVRILLAL